MRLNLARTVRRSAVNGPGERFVVWVQGCPLACPGCWNPDTWAFERRILRSTTDLVAEILSVGGIEGVTFTGGEPFVQARALAEVGRAVQAAGLSVLVFTGFRPDELTSEAAQQLLDVTDVIVSGRYIESAKIQNQSLRGSANQQVHFLSSRYGASDLDDAAEAEFHLDAEGRIALTGFPSEQILAVIRRPVL